MSLINDALKRARQSHARQSPAPAPGPPLQPVLHAVSGPRSTSKLTSIGATAVLILGCSFLFVSWRNARTNAEAVPFPRTQVAKAAVKLDAPHPTPIIAAASAAATNSVTPAQLPSVPSAPAKAPQVPPSVTLARSEVPAPVEVDRGHRDEPLSAEAAADSNPTNLKLQGIFYRASRASALIDGETLFVGDEIEGSKVVSIDRKSVRLLKQGKTIVLKLR